MRYGVSGWLRFASIIAAFGSSLLFAQNPSALIGEWRLLEFQSMDDAQGTAKPRAGSLYTMQLEENGQAHFTLDCNRANGRWDFKPAGDESGEITIETMQMTRAKCPEPNLDEQFAKNSQYIRSYLLKGDRLALSMMADGGIYLWERVQNDATEETQKEPRNWEVTQALNLRENPSTASKSLLRYTSGTILDNLGCKSIAGDKWCDVQQLGGGARGYVSQKFLKPAVSPDGSVATGEDDSALRAGEERYDAIGEIPCAEHTGEPMHQCAFGVARAGGGYATVVVTQKSGKKRSIYFRMGKTIGSDASEADGYQKFSSTKEVDLYMIRIGDERYEIPEAVIFGG